MKPFFITTLLGLTLQMRAQEVHPTLDQVKWQALETDAFLHFTVNTFTDKEWGDGTESPAVFNPVNFDARKIIGQLKAAGFKMAIITAKHHDGFCLWPSKFTDHSVKNCPWKNGKGDIVKEIAEACHEYGMKFGFYLSPWDRHELSYGTSEYNTFYENQLTELLTQYGPVSEVWFDGAKGANAKAMNYDFPAYWRLVKKYQPHAVIFSDAGPDIRWVGNESGNAGETCWSTINNDTLAPGHADPAYLNSGDPEGRQWVPAETDVSIRPEWFYHENENDKVKSGKQIVDLYYKSVGRNSLLLLNIPPDKEGQLFEKDVESINDFHRIIASTFAVNLLKGSVAKTLTDKKPETFVVVSKSSPLEIRFAKPLIFDRILLQENIAHGQRVEKAMIQYLNKGHWITLTSFTTIGYKKLLRFPAITAQGLRLSVTKSKGRAELSELGCYRSTLE